MFQRCIPWSLPSGNMVNGKYGTAIRYVNKVFCVLIGWEMWSDSFIELAFELALEGWKRL